MYRRVIPDRELDHKVYDNNHQEWRYQGRLHRDQGPAVIRPDGVEIWHQHGLFHREDGPAVTYENQAGSWYLHDELHTFETYCEELKQLRGESHVTYIRLKWIGTPDALSIF